LLLIFGQHLQITDIDVQNLNFVPKFPPPKWILSPNFVFGWKFFAKNRNFPTDQNLGGQMLLTTMPLDYQVQHRVIEHKRGCYVSRLKGPLNRAFAAYSVNYIAEKIYT